MGRCRYPHGPASPPQTGGTARTPRAAISRMMFLAALLLCPWLVRVRRAPLTERLHRLEVLFWLVVISATLAFGTAAALQTLTGPPPRSAPPAVDRVSV